MDKKGFLTLGPSVIAAVDSSTDERRNTDVSIKVPSQTNINKKKQQENYNKTETNNNSAKSRDAKQRKQSQGRNTLQIQSVLNENAAKRRVSLKISRYHLDEKLTPEQYEKLTDDMYQQHRESFSIRRPSQIPAANSALKLKIDEMKQRSGLEEGGESETKKQQ